MKKKNYFKIDGDVCTLYLKRKNGKPIKALIDAKNLFVINVCRWYALYSPITKTYYVQGNIEENGKYKKIYLHRYLMNNPKGLQIDHINQDTLDNRFCNLRVVTAEKNCQNHKKHSQDAYKIKKADVVHILSSDDSAKSLGRQYGVSDTLIRHIRHGKAYKSYHPEIPRWQPLWA